MFFKKLFGNKNYRKVRDHCHYTGKYRDALHSISNLKFNLPNEIPVVFFIGIKIMIIILSNKKGNYKNLQRW